MKKYIGYIRVSTEEQVSGYGLDAQRASIEAYCMAMGYELEQIFVDEGESGAKTERPALQEVLALVSTGEYAGVIVMKLDRLSRKLKDILNMHDDVFLPNDTAIISVKEQFDTSNAMGRLFFQIIGSFAEFEREVIKERMVGGKIEKAKKGIFAGGSAAYGYDVINGELVVNETEAVAVRRIFQMRADQMTLQSIADILNRDGTPTKRGRKWSKVVIKQILDRESFYRGMYKYSDIVVKGQHTPILPMDEANSHSQNEVK